MMQKITWVVILAFALASCTSAVRRHRNYVKGVTLSPEAVSVLAGSELPNRTNVPLDAVLIYSAINTAVGQSNLSRKEVAAQPSVGRVVATALILNSDIQCEILMNDVVEDTKSALSGTGIAAIGLSSAASLTTPLRNSQLLSGLSAFVSGAEDELSNIILDGNSPDLIYRAIMAARAKERSRLLALLENEKITPDYVIGQIPAYHGICGTSHAISALSSAVDEAKQSAPEKGGDQADREAKSILSRGDES